MRRWSVALLMGLSLAGLAGCGGDQPVAAAREGGRGERGGQGQGEEKRPDLPSREVRLAEAEQAKLSRTVPVSGALAADEEAELGMKVAGRLASIAVDLGSRVRRGQVIARLIPTDSQIRVSQAESALEQARAQLGLEPNEPVRRVAPEQTALVKQAAANLTQAKLTRDRMARLFQEQLIPQSDFDAAEAALQVAEARYQEAVETAHVRQALLAQRASELRLARQQLADSTLTAPFDGVISERRAGVGDYLAVGDPVVVLVRVHPLRLRLELPERDVFGVRVGQPVKLTVEGDPGEHTGRVARISPSISEENRTLLVEAEVPNHDGRLRPGAFARAEIVTESEDPAVLVPSSSVISFAGIEKVMSVEDGHAVEKRVKTGRRAGDRVEILEGIAAGEPVVLEPGNLVGGQPIRVAP
ncbi:MAG TPA: efflux RND transporter periplasmic adaptor subunit [Thermoanaerobaculia bacterium]